MIRFGLIADTHVSDKPDDSKTISEKAGWTEYSTGSLDKIEAFAQRMNGNDVDFVAILGDFICSPADTKAPYEDRRAKSLELLQEAESRLSQFKGPRYHVLGNHDTDQLAKEDVMAKITNSGIPSGKSYYSFDKGGIHFIVLDPNYKADGNALSGVPGAAGAGYTWKDTFIPESEVSWLKQDLAASKGPVIILTHQLLNPQEQVDADFELELKVPNADEVRSILEKSGRVLAVFGGHYHSGGYQFYRGIHYVTLQGNVAFGNDVSHHNQYDTVEVNRNGSNYQLIISGNGKCKSFSLSSTLA